MKKGKSGQYGCYIVLQKDEEAQRLLSDVLFGTLKATLSKFKSPVVERFQILSTDGDVKAMDPHNRLSTFGWKCRIREAKLEAKKNVY